MNPRPPESQSGALPTELQPPLIAFSCTGYIVSSSLQVLARLAGLEPATYGLEGRCSIRLSYRRFRKDRIRSDGWSGRRDSNPRHPAPKAGALPGCATPRISTRPSEAAYYSPPPLASTKTPKIISVCTRFAQRCHACENSRRKSPASKVHTRDNI